MSTKLWIIMGAVAIFFMLLGSYLGVNKYKTSYPISKVYEDGSFYGCMEHANCND